MTNDVKFLMTVLCVGIGVRVAVGMGAVGNVTTVLLGIFEVPEIHMNLCMDL